MQIDVKLVQKRSLEEFADEHNLVMEVVEREHHGNIYGNGYHVSRFYAHFKKVDIKEGFCLIGSTGNGETQEEAIEDYMREISNKLIVFDAFSETDRKELWVPNLISVYKPATRNPV